MHLLCISPVYNKDSFGSTPDSRRVFLVQEERGERRKERSPFSAAFTHATVDRGAGSSCFGTRVPHRCIKCRRPVDRMVWRRRTGLLFARSALCVWSVSTSRDVPTCTLGVATAHANRVLARCWTARGAKAVYGAPLAV
jgi:hypothetical protein